MANVSFHIPFDTRYFSLGNPYDAYDALLTSSQVTLYWDGAYGDRTVFFGSFQIAGEDVVGGTIASVNDYVDGIQQYTATNLNYSAIAYKSYAVSGNARGFLADVLKYGDTLLGSSGADYLESFAGSDVLDGAGGNDTLLGGTGNDSLGGGADNDQLDGGGGTDSMTGGLGNDTYLVDIASDVVSEASGGGTDLVASGVTFSFAVAGRGELENLTLTGTAAVNGTGNAKANVLTGNASANVLNGGAGHDSLIGGGGNDTLAGRAGLDRLTGGLGADKFRFVLANEGMDTITDFSAAQGDKLVFVSPNFGGLAVGGLAAGRFRSNTTGLAGDADDRFIFETDTRILRYDADGSGAGTAIQIAKLNISTLAAGNILVAAS